MDLTTEAIPLRQDDFGTHIINIPLGNQKPRIVMDESNLEASYYNKVALNWTDDAELKVPE